MPPALRTHMKDLWDDASHDASSRHGTRARALPQGSIFLPIREKENRPDWAGQVERRSHLAGVNTDPRHGGLVHPTVATAQKPCLRGNEAANDPPAYPSYSPGRGTYGSTNAVRSRPVKQYT